MGRDENLKNNTGLWGKEKLIKKKNKFEYQRKLQKKFQSKELKKKRDLFISQSFIVFYLVEENRKLLRKVPSTNTKYTHTHTTSTKREASSSLQHPRFASTLVFSHLKKEKRTLLVKEF